MYMFMYLMAHITVPRVFPTDKTTRRVNHKSDVGATEYVA